jgi:hypothetical protein
VQQQVLGVAVRAVPVFLATLAVPGGAFVQVARGIYNGVLTFVEKGKQIAQVGTALLGSVSAIAAGQLAPAAQAVETTLVKVLPVALSFLARWLGLDGISGAIQTGLQKVQAPVERAVGKVLDAVVDKAKAIWGAVKGSAGKAVDKGQRVAAATQPADRRTLPQKQAALDQALTAGTSLLRNHHLTPEAVVRGLLQLRQQHQLTDLRIRQDGTTPQAQRLHLHGAVNPEQEGPTVERPGSSDFNQVEIFPPAPHPLESAERALLDADTRQWLDKHRPAPGSSLTQASGVSPELARRVMAKAYKAFWEAPNKGARPKTVAGMEFTTGTIIVAPARSRGTGGGDGQLPEGLHEQVKAVLNAVWHNYQQEQQARAQ